MDCEVLHDFCKNCRKTRVAQKEGPKDSITGKPAYKAGDFIVNCTGIPGDNKFIPNYDKVVQHLDEQDIEEAQGVYDAVTWAERYLNWKPRSSRTGEEYQALALRCSSKRKVYRWGRRLGKTDNLAVEGLHFLYTNSPKAQRYDKYREEWVQGFGTALVLTPFLSQVKNLFGRMRELIALNPELQNEVKRDVSTPYHCIELHNGCKIVGFSAGSSGAESVRGQKADHIILDEMDYLDEESIETILALLMEHSDVSLTCASTPTGRREYFYRFCRERMDFKEFHYTSSANPSWSPAMEAELREFYNTEAGWQHEIMAEFGEATTSVFQHQYVQAGRVDYRYEHTTREENCTYSIGIDWNDQENGTKICVLEWNPERMKFRVVQTETVQKMGWTQTAAIEKLIELNRAWRAAYVYVDQGYGATQIEVIKQYGMSKKYANDENAAIDARLANVVGINSSSKVEIFDPATNEVIKKPMKPFMVENAVRRFEQGIVDFSVYDEMLYKQLIGYSVAKINASGMPVYEKGPDGDHDLDALVLSLLAFQMEESEFTNQQFNAAIAVAGKFGEGRENAEGAVETLAQVLNNQTMPKGMKSQVPEQRSGYGGTKVASLGLPGVTDASGGARIYSPEAFNNDDRSRKSQRKKNGGFLKRGGFRTSRRSF
jgi:hypothetical protein